MNIAYDHHIFTNQRFGGISRYFAELFNEFDILNDINYVVPALYSVNHYLLSSGKSKEFLPNINFVGKKKVITMINNCFMPYELNKSQFDLFHPTYYDSHFLKYLKGKKFVLTIHDMTPEIFKGMVGGDQFISEKKKQLANRAERIIAVSENTKKDLINLWNINESKIDVIYHGNSMIVNSSPVNIKGVPDEYILYVGARHEYKNFSRFIHALAPILNKNQNLSVICAGGKSMTVAESKLFEKLKIKSQVIQISINDQTLSSLYSNAKMFVFPSLYEGFGIPLLEAFACKCPIVCSDNSCFPEIAGEAALYFDPLSEDSMRHIISTVLGSTELQKDLAKRGEKQLLHYSWKKTATETKKVYEKCL